MHTLRLHPNEVLKPFVRHIEIVENEESNSILSPLPFYADGCPGLIYQETDNGMLVNNDKQKLSNLFVYGQTVKPIEFLPQGAYRMIIFYFYPHVIKSLYGINSSEITDACLDLSAIKTTASLSECVDQLGNTHSTVQQVEIISLYLARIVISKNTLVDKTINYAISHILKENGQTSLKDLRTYLQVSERTFERRFEQHVGVNAKLFARICQFQNSLTQLYNKDFNKLSDLAYDNGYSDQSHFIRSFKEFTGASPLEFKKQLSIATAAQTAVASHLIYVTVLFYLVFAHGYSFVL